ncbi:MAG: hypothetical protein L6420_08590 [Elusimicrobia bacterium]|nr:hypothetical protein [Elusimicrobiota bacterium]
MNSSMKTISIFLFFCLYCAAPAISSENKARGQESAGSAQADKSQAVTIKYSLSPSIENIKLAQPFKLIFEISQSSYSKNIKIDITEQDTQPFEIISIKELGIETPQDKNLANKKFEFNIIPFEIGIATFPALSWSFQNEEEKTFKFKSPAITIDILPYLKKEDKDVRDIYPPFQFFSIWKAIIIFIIIAAIIAVAIAIIRKKNISLIPKTKMKDIKTPYQKAMENIRILAASKLWTEGKQKKFYIRLSDILRLYIMDEFSIVAPLMTTNTLLKKLKASNDDIELLIKVKKLLQFSDLVKFAKFKPSDTEKDRDIAASKEIIESFHSYRLTACEHAQAIEKKENSKEAK